MSPKSELIDALIEQRIAEMSEPEFNALLTRTRAPSTDTGGEIPDRGSVVPSVGNRPDNFPHSETDEVRIAEKTADWAKASALKAAQLVKQINDQSRRGF